MRYAEGSERQAFSDELLAEFVGQSSELLERLNGNLALLEEFCCSLARPDDASGAVPLLDDMVRSARSLKGLSEMLGLGEVNDLVGQIENVLDAARQEELLMTADVVQLVGHGIQNLSTLIECARMRGSDFPDCREVRRALQEVLRCAGASAAAVPASDHFAGINDETEIPAKYLSIFIDETSLALDTLTETLLNLEAGGSPKAIADLLITSHRIKGSAACVGLNRAAKLAHLMEDLVQRLRDRSGAVTPAIADAMLKCTDALRTYLDGLTKGSPDARYFAPAADELLAAQATELFVVGRPAACAPPQDMDSPRATACPARGASRPAEAIGGPRAELRDRVAAHLGDREGGLYGVVTFAPGLALVGLKARLVYEKLVSLGDVFYCEPAAEALDELEALESLVFGVATGAEIDAVHRHLRIAGVERVVAAALAPVPAHESPQANAAQSGTNRLRDVVSRDAPGPQSAVAASSASRIAEPTPAVTDLFAPRDDDASASKGEPAKSTADAAGKPTETLRVDIERLDQLMNLAGQLVINKARFNRIGDTLKQASAANRAPNALAGAMVLLEKIAAWADPAHFERIAPADLESVRAHARSVQSQLTVVREALDQFGTIRGAVNGLGDAVHQLDRVAEGIQRGVMDIRMVPIGPLFVRFRRVIRDMSRANGKDIRLVIRGEKTELDKRMIDELSDPLIHMIRNSADHGIESPEARLAMGKPREGTITLDAFQRGNAITIQVTDDGRGLDDDRIRAKAVEKGILSPLDAQMLTPHQAYQLIWAPGFSTADKVTEVSGRGMGMDIVKSKIEDINGTVELHSTPGKGTTLTIKLPLTLAILPSLMAQIDGEVFALPIESVVEIVSVAPHEMTRIHGLPNALVRGRVVSVASLSEIFTWATPQSLAATKPSPETTLVIVGCEGRELGLIVDRLLGEEDIVIKSMAENYQNVQGIAGASILGDGRVSLILDTAVLIDMASSAVAARQTPVSTIGI